MSDSLMVFHPTIEEPSNIRPSSSSSSPMTELTIDRCCHLPLGSVKRRSTHSISSSLIRFTISDALAMVFLPCECAVCLGRSRPGPAGDGGLDRRFVLLAGADAQRRFDRGDEDLPVADAPGLRRCGDRLDGFLGERVRHDDLELHLGEEVHDVLGAAVELGVALLPAEAL